MFKLLRLQVFFHIHYLFLLDSLSSYARQFLGIMEKIQEIINRHEKVFPAKLELNFSNPLELLVAVVLAAQATDKKVNEVTQDLLK